MSRISTTSVLAITGLTVFSGLVAYAAYFDYKRRSDPQFRKKLRTQKKKVEKVAAEEKKVEEAQRPSASDVPPDLLRAIFEKAREDPVPTDPEERHKYFMAMVSQAERLAQEGPQNYLEAAIYFYQGLRVYPSPMELIAIYQSTVPERCLSIVMELYGLDVLQRIHGYYEQFPPEGMNVAVKQNDPKESKAGGQTRFYSLVTTRSFKAGEEIYKESPVVATLDVDVQGRGTHCTHCLRHIVKGMAIIPDSDPLNAVYCSKKCQLQSKVQSQNLLFGNESPVPMELTPDMASNADVRLKSQRSFVDFWKSVDSPGLLLVARFVAMQIIAEFAKAMPQAGGMKAELPAICLTGEYTAYDHMERLRFVDVSVPDGEHKSLKNLLLSTLPFLEDAHADERHAVFRGKMAYNAIGVCFSGGREDKPTLTEKSERSRTPYGTSKQVGSGLYFVSSYLNHSCSPSVRPSFSNGTSELHLIATRDIKEGEELTMAYVDVAQHKDETLAEARKRRRAELALGWKFACGCARCEEEEKKIKSAGEGEVPEPDALPSKDGARLEGSLAQYGA